jgi:hypothetical protein
MNRPAILDALPTTEEHARGAEPASQPQRPRAESVLLWFVLAVGGWCVRLLIGALCCMTYVSSILVIGWLYRWIQGRTLYAWYKKSPRAKEISFEEFRATLGVDAPVTRPRWLFREDLFDIQRMQAEVRAPNTDGEPPLALKRAIRWVLAPFRSLWLNARIGVQGFLATFLVAGWGAALMTFAWEFGWRNSFAKGYEDAKVGMLMGLLGMALLSLGMLYVPMAQIHQAVTGDFKAFFDFRFIWRLIRARLTAYFWLAFLFAGFGIWFEILKTLPIAFDRFPGYDELSDSELLLRLRWYFFVCGGFLLVTLLFLRFVAAAIYRSAVMKVLRRGRIRREEVHPRLVGWFDELRIWPETKNVPGVGERLMRGGFRASYRPLGFTLLFLLWLVPFSFRTYVGEFFNYHSVVGILNQPLVQAPYFNFVPSHLVESASPETASVADPAAPSP